MYFMNGGYWWEIAGQRMRMQDWSAELETDLRAWGDNGSYRTVQEGGEKGVKFTRRALSTPISPGTKVVNDFSGEQ